jgi:hypothetical protein
MDTATATMTTTAPKTRQWRYKQDDRTPESKLVKCQRKVYGWKVYTENGRTYRIKATVRHDDECGNGHNTFAITGEIEEKRGNQFREDSGGCLHEEISKRFPELEPLIKWHLMSTDEPMYYVANTVYHAGNRDHRGLRKGERRQLRNGKTDLPVWERVVRDGNGEIVKGGHDWRDSAEQPQETLTVTWEPVWIIGEGKEREFNHARSSAVWPEATDKELSVEPAELRAKLLERLPTLMAEFKRAVESLGLIY